jgi:hypothetical protein
MKKQFLYFLATIVASCIVMILHEFPKSIIYNKMAKPNNKDGNRHIYKFYQYIDPIGLVLSVTSLSGFSRPYMYRVKDKKTNTILGITGFISLICMILFGVGTYNLLYAGAFQQNIDPGFLYYLMESFILISCGMLIVNLFPISTFDMGLLIAGRSPITYFTIIKNDYFIKMILLLFIIMNIISTLSLYIVSSLLAIKI